MNAPRRMKSAAALLPVVAAVSALIGVAGPARAGDTTPDPYILECGTVSYGQLYAPQPLEGVEPYRLELATVGQPFFGILPGPDSGPVVYQFECGFIYCVQRPPTAYTDVVWIRPAASGIGSWQVASNWTPAQVPSNDPPNDLFYRATIGDAASSLQARLVQSADVSRVTLIGGARLVMDELSTQQVQLGIDRRVVGSTADVFNFGQIDVSSGNEPESAGDRFPKISGARLVQSPAAEIFVHGANNPISLFLLNCSVIGGRLRTSGVGTIRLVNTLVSDAVLEGVIISGDNEASATAMVQGGIISNDLIRVGPPAGSGILGIWLLTPNTESGASISGSGDIQLTSEAGARFGGPVGRLTLGAAQTLHGEGSIVGGVDNHGIVEASVPAKRLAVNAGAQALMNAADGTMQASGGGILQLQSPVTSGGTILATGAGSTLQVQAPLTSNGTLQLDSGAQGSTTAPLVVGAGGTVIVVGAGTLLTVGDDVNSGGLRQGEVHVRGGTIEVNPGGPNRRRAYADCVEVAPGSISHANFSRTDLGLMDLLISGGIVQLTNSTAADVTNTVDVCPAAAPPGAVAELHVLGSTLAAGDLHICGDGVIEVASGISVNRSLDFDGTDETRWSWSPSSTLTVTGGVGLPDDDPAGYATVEVGGGDLGMVATPSGNFSVPRLILGAGAHASLVDHQDNGNRGADLGPNEVLYVETLELRPGALLNLNGLRLYYHTLASGSPSQIVDLILHGDMNCDGVVDNSDIDPFVLALINGDAYIGAFPGCPYLAADCNGDGVVDNSDIDSFVQLLIGG